MEKLTKEEIKKNEKYFSFYTILPKIVTLILGILYFILGIVYCAITEEAGILFAIWFGGSIVCVVTYLILTLILSYRILHICYLKDISDKLNAKENEKVTTEEKPQE